MLAFSEPLDFFVHWLARAHARAGTCLCRYVSVRACVGHLLRGNWGTLHASRCRSRDCGKKKQPTRSQFDWIIALGWSNHACLGAGLYHNQHGWASVPEVEECSSTISLCSAVDGEHTFQSWVSNATAWHWCKGNNSSSSIAAFQGWVSNATTWHWCK